MARDLLNESSSDSESSSDEGVTLKVNEEFAKRFEHNKKREELQKLEEKHGQSKKRKRGDNDDPSSGSEDSSTDSEDEDDAGEFATVALDSEIMATLNAIRSKDPRVYDGKTTFYSAIEEDVQPKTEKTEKPLYLKDYHRENLLNGSRIADKDVPLTYEQEQAQMAQKETSAINEMFALDEDQSDGDDFVPVERERPVETAVVLDVESADRDPETFLSNFMASRAWVPTENSTYKPLESDDEEDEKRAEAYEIAYNMRFEDPNKSNETLRTHARDMAAKYSVRRDEANARQKKRDAEKEKKQIAKQQHKEEKARLRKLRIEQVEEKVKQIKRAAGLGTSDIRPEDWAKFVDDEWDDARWEQEMQQRFGDDYYAEEDVISDDDGTEKKRKAKKPKFDDDIDINDIVPDFKQSDPEISLSEEEGSKKNHKKAREDKKRESKRERRIIEQLVDDQLQYELDSVLPGKSTGFRYRETSPHAFGLSARDILMADDSQLNQYAGLKKLAAFRDPDKKNKDKKHLGKKARLRQWRKETFGNEDGLQDSELLPAHDVVDANEDEDGEMSNIRTTGKKKRRRGKKSKISEVA